MLDKKKSNLALLALAISAFAIGTTEFISVGLLPLIASDFKTPLETAGLTVSIYALGVTIGAPVLTAITSKISRKTLLLWIMIVFILGNSLAAIAPSIPVLLFARILSALSHGIFMSIGSTIAADLVSKEKRAGAISIMFSGLTVATVTGVPLGTFLGQHFGWRLAFFAIVIIGIIALVANTLVIPKELSKGKKATFREQYLLLTNKRLLLMFLITAFGYGGTFVVFTYLSPILHDITGFKESTVAGILLLYGLAIAVGNLIGGRLANKKPLISLFFMFLVQAIILFALYFTLPNKLLGLISIILMGLLAFMNVPGLQVYVVMLAERYVPKAVDVASALNIAAFNGGIAIGSYLGGSINQSLGLIHTAWIGGLMVLIAVGLTAISLIFENNKGIKEK